METICCCSFTLWKWFFPLAPSKTQLHRDKAGEIERERELKKKKKCLYKNPFECFECGFTLFQTVHLIPLCCMLFVYPYLHPLLPLGWLPFAFRQPLSSRKYSTFHPILAYGFVGETNSALQSLANGIEMCILISRLNKGNDGCGFVSSTFIRLPSGKIANEQANKHFSIFNQQNYNTMTTQYNMENWDDIILLNLDFLFYIWCVICLEPNRAKF